MEKGHGAVTKQRGARVHRRGGVHDVAADGAVGTRGVGADDGGGVGQPGEAPLDKGMRHQCLVGDEGADVNGSPVTLDLVEAGDPVDADQRLRQPLLTLPRPHHQVGATGDRTRPCGEGRDGIFDGQRSGVGRHGQ